MDPKFSQFSHVILDEVHERSQELELIVLLLRKLVTESDGWGGKIVIMSATVDSMIFCSYFREMLPHKEVSDPYFVGAKRYHIRNYFLFDLNKIPTSTSSLIFQKQAACNLKKIIDEIPPECPRKRHLTPAVIGPRSMSICVEVLVSMLTGGESALVFLPGIADITALHDHLEQCLIQRRISHCYQTYILHSMISRRSGRPLQATVF